MSPRRFTTRKDSFGLEIREDGSIGFSISPNEETATDLNAQKVAERRECGDDSPRIIGSDSWKSIVSLTRTKRRRDSFGLEVREDGTLSFDQLATANGEPKASGNMRRKTTSGGMGIIGLRRTMTQPGRNRRRCDSFGLEIREDGTLSLNPEAGVRPAGTRSSGNNSVTNDDRMHGAQPSGGQVPDVEIIPRTRTRIHPQSTHIYPQNENNTSISFATNAHVTGSQMEHQPTLADEGRANSLNTGRTFIMRRNSYQLISRVPVLRQLGVGLRPRGGDDLHHDGLGVAIVGVMFKYSRLHSQHSQRRGILSSLYVFSYHTSTKENVSPILGSHLSFGLASALRLQFDYKTDQ
ncbi:hypothetical protein Agabi119p4_11598 [Agaricus bisporus var. burnettii]|uniref:Uncharacterized protein n=1 Tax=Agaricus bisporus var. burnettii TaxID=192524 RepID=A0A8H7C0I8_AGABI|nr:hypothetical protein Agabi119p4_11598 [Agaricus bisporus var. burnettii]